MEASAQRRETLLYNWEQLSVWRRRKARNFAFAHVTHKRASDRGILRVHALQIRCVSNHWLLHLLFALQWMLSLMTNKLFKTQFEVQTEMHFKDFQAVFQSVSNVRFDVLDFVLFLRSVAEGGGGSVAGGSPPPQADEGHVE